MVVATAGCTLNAPAPPGEAKSDGHHQPPPDAPVKRDLSAIQSAGRLRVLVPFHVPTLPKASAPFAEERSALNELAAHLNVHLELLPQAPEALTTALTAGHGDALAGAPRELPAELTSARAVALRDRKARWVVRSDQPDLLAALNNFVFQRELTRHTRDRYQDDLAALKARGVVRVGMLNNPASYFIYRGQQAGFQYELAALLAARLGLRLEVVVPDEPRHMLDLLLEGRVDVVPRSQALPPHPGVARTAPLVFAHHMLVQSHNETPITRVQELADRTVTVRASSSYFGHLVDLQRRIPTLRVKRASEHFETQDLIEEVGAGRIELTVANSVLLGMERTWRDDIRGTLVVAPHQGLSYATRENAPNLLARLERFAEEEPQKADYRRIYHKYFQNPERMADVLTDETAQTAAISPFDELVQRYARKHRLDWRLVVAQMYQESRFNPRAVSFAGATGLMQLMPRTAAELGVKDLLDPEENIAGGVRYLAQLLARFETTLPMRQRVRMALASYNAGYYHVQDARRLARQKGLNPDRWFGQVEKTIVLLEKPRYHRHARHGFCRGREAVAYVSRIQSKYDGYVALVEADGSLRH